MSNTITTYREYVELIACVLGENEDSVREVAQFGSSSVYGLDLFPINQKAYNAMGTLKFLKAIFASFGMEVALHTIRKQTVYTEDELGNDLITNDLCAYVSIYRPVDQLRKCACSYGREQGSQMTEQTFGLVRMADSDVRETEINGHIVYPFNNHDLCPQCGESRAMCPQWRGWVNLAELAHRLNTAL